MSRKKKKKQNPVPASESALPATPSPRLPTSEEYTRQISFDSLEDRIRGEEMMQDQEDKKLKETQDIKKQLDSAEVDRRMEELRRQLGLKNDLPGPRKRKP